MAEDILVDVDVAYTAEVSQKGKRIRSEVVLSGRATVLLAKVSAAEAPKVIEVRWPDAAALTSMHWRSFDGALWRPLVGPDGSAFAGGFGEAAEAAMPAGRGPGRPVWSDYPFKAVSQKTGHDRSLPFGLPADAGTARVHSDTLEAARRQAQKTAADDLLMVDGVLHMRSQPPVWAVGRTYAGPWDAAGHVRLALADHDEHVDRLASFPLDRREDAVEFGRIHAEHVGRHDLYRRRNLRVPVSVAEDAEIWHADMDFADPRMDDLRRALGTMDRDLEDARLSKSVREAIQELVALADAETSEWPSEATDAAVALVAGADPMWTVTWPNMGGFVERVRALTLRDGFQSGLDLQADAEAFSGIGP